MNVQILADVSVALRGIVVESVGFFANETWQEKYVDAMETVIANRNDVSIWEFEGLRRAA